MPLLLALDVGNTNVVIGLYDGPQLTISLRMYTDRKRTADEYGLMVKSFLRDLGHHLDELEAVAVSCVVPALRTQLEEMCERHLRCRSLFVGSDLLLPLVLKIDRPSELGADLIAAGVAAFEKYGGPLIVIDMGTATTISAITQEGAFLGTAIAPGLATSTEAIYSQAPHLPRIKMESPPSPIGTNTVHSLQVGLVTGHAALVDGLVARITAELQKRGEGKPRVIATGGLSDAVAAAGTTIETIDPDLVLEGIRLIWERNR